MREKCTGRKRKTWSIYLGNCPRATQKWMNKQTNEWMRTKSTMWHSWESEFGPQIWFHNLHKTKIPVSMVFAIKCRWSWPQWPHCCPHHHVDVCRYQGRPWQSNTKEPWGDMASLQVTHPGLLIPEPSPLSTSEWETVCSGGRLDLFWFFCLREFGIGIQTTY